jgi:broad specificity phosphatase PhoE
MRLLFEAVALVLAPVAAPASPVAEARQLQPVAATHPVFIIRHMQKTEGTDPPLSTEGTANAERLAAILKGKGIVAIFATPTRRAMETAAPLANLLGLTVVPYDPANPALLAKRVAAAGGPVLIVGHSNTVPNLVALFGGTKPAPLSEQDYGTLYDVEPGGSVVTSTVR